MDLILNLAPTGMVPTRQMTPHVPLTPDEVIADVLACHEIGLTSVHLHARDEAGAPTYRKEIFAEMIAGLRARAPELVLCVSCSGRTFTDLEQRAEVLDLEGDLKPDMASLTPSSMNFPRSASVNSPEVVKELATRMRDRAIKPEIEAFDVGMIHYAKYLIDRGFLTPPFYFNLMLGNVATAQPDPLHVGLMIRELPPGSVWALGGIGAAALPALATAVAHGGGVRIGLEDNLWLDPARTRLASNHDLVRRAHELARLLERPTMPPAELRRLLDLPNGPQAPRHGEQ